ncbi:hypothetical protein H4S02_004439 [Coemansia sp. RSA 2611]|nr:hypothetical protein H4S02_004439 [Coemansia sp. RSA 2611]
MGSKAAVKSARSNKATTKESKRKRRESTSSSSSSSSSSSESESESDSSSSSSSDSDSSLPSTKSDKKMESASSSSSSSSDSDSSSSSDSDSSSSSENDSDGSSDSDSDSSSDSDSDSDSDNDTPKEIKHLAKHQANATRSLKKIEGELSGYVATNLDLVQQRKESNQQETDLRVAAKFKEIYMDYITTGFGADLDTLRKEGDINDETLELLVDALETGIQSFAASDQKMIVDEAS